jgi:hypothetical protein
VKLVTDKKDRLLASMNRFLRSNSKTELATKLGFKSTHFFYSWNNKGAVPAGKRKLLKEVLGVK